MVELRMMENPVVRKGEHVSESIPHSGVAVASRKRKNRTNGNCMTDEQKKACAMINELNNMLEIWVYRSMGII